ncbi:MAG TPA: GntR family transcriptional regulator [Steroidobacteraceae bacterium]
MRSQTAPSLEDRLYQVIHADIAAGSLPAGALLPCAERVAEELAIEPAAVAAAYARLLSEGFLDARDGGALAIACRGEETHIGDGTQIRFEAALLRAVREAAARGMSTHEATGIFRATMQRIGKD